jgi:hypothetical protein
LSDNVVERDSGVADLSRLHDNGRSSQLDTYSSPPLSGITTMGAGVPTPSKKPHRRGFSRFQHASGGERPGARAKGASSDGSNGKKLSIDATGMYVCTYPPAPFDLMCPVACVNHDTARLALSEDGEESTPAALAEINPQQLARLTAMHATPISPRGSPSTPRAR